MQWLQSLQSKNSVGAPSESKQSQVAQSVLGSPGLSDHRVRWDKSHRKRSKWASDDLLSRWRNLWCGHPGAQVSGHDRSRNLSRCALGIQRINWGNLVGLALKSGNFGSLHFLAMR